MSNEQCPPEERRWRPRFTLLHLTVAVFLTGIGVGVWFSYTHTELFVPRYLSQRPESGVSGCAVNLTRIGLALEAFYHDHKSFPLSQHELVPQYLKELPICPSAQRMTYRTAFGSRVGHNTSGNPQSFLVECCGTNHEKHWVAPDFPAYDSQSGLLLERAW